MLDQNTDRMWYVIGAVLVGAAIILIANGTLPQMFASVTNSFEESSTKATDVIDSIGISEEAATQVQSIEDSFHIDYFERGGVEGREGGLLDDNWRSRRIRHKDLYPIHLVREVEISFNADNYQMALMYYREDGSKISSDITGGDWKTEIGLYAVPDDAHYIRIVIGPGDRDSSGHDSGIGLDEFGLVDAKLRIVSER